jgi:hypothetical protein
MRRLEDLTPAAQVKGVLPGGPVTTVDNLVHFGLRETRVLL